MKLPLGYSLLHFEEVDCLMARARTVAEAGADEGTLLFAERQLAGKGRFGKAWHSTPGSVQAVLILRPEFPAGLALQLVHVAMLSLGSAIAEQVSPMTELRIRWPNALLLSRGRAAGLFVDMAPCASQDDIPAWMNIGFVVNMESYPQGFAMEAAALAGDGDCTPQRDALVEAFARHFLAGINRWAEEGFAPFRRRWLRQADGIGTPAAITLRTTILQGMARDLDEEGSLVLETQNGGRLRVTLADYFALPR